MSWYKAGTVAVTSGSASVLGTGTQWVSKLKIGEVFYAPDGKLYEIEAISSDTTLTLTLPYAGDSNTAGAYVVIPTQGYLRSLASNVADLIALYQAVPENVEHAEAAATNAAASAATATDKATLAETARSFAVFAKAAAEAAQVAAEAARDSATASATTATGEASEAAASATTASAAKDTAVSAAATATAKAGEAAASESSVVANAATSTTKANEAAASAAAALASQNSASASATTATTKASEAATSATTASTGASTATTKASEAATSASNALTYRNQTQAIADQVATTPVTKVAGRTGDVVLTKADVGLPNVDNTADAAKPISTLTQNALDLKAPKDGPTFTGAASFSGSASVTGKLSAQGGKIVADYATDSPGGTTSPLLKVKTTTANEHASVWLDASTGGTPFQLFLVNGVKRYQINYSNDLAFYAYDATGTTATTMFNVTKGGLITANGGLTMLGSGLESGGNYQSRSITVNPNWGDITIQGYHVPGNWAGLRFVMSGTSFEFRHGGVAAKPGGGSWADVSDIRTKHNIVDYTVGLSEVLALRPRVFSYLEATGRNPDQRFVGLIAQEAETAMPDVVRTEAGKLGELSFEDLRAIDPSNIPYALINAIHTLHSRIAALEAKS